MVAFIAPAIKSISDGKNLDIFAAAFGAFHNRPSSPSLFFPVVS
jgi:hypothetical protein